MSDRKFLVQSGLFVFLVLADVFMFTMLLRGLSGGELTAPIAAIIGGLVGAVTASLGLAAKDLFNPKD